MALTSEVQEKIKNSLKLRQLIGVEIGFGEQTVAKWNKKNSPRLCAPAVIKVISKELGLEKSKILSED